HSIFRERERGAGRSACPPDVSATTRSSLGQCCRFPYQGAPLNRPRRKHRFPVETDTMDDAQLHNGTFPKLLEGQFQEAAGFGHHAGGHSPSKSLNCEVSLSVRVHSSASAPTVIHKDPT